MKMHIDINSIDELAAFFAVIRGEPLDGPALEALTKRLRDSAVALKAAEDAVQPQT